jgi:hypothetical protein
MKATLAHYLASLPLFRRIFHTSLQLSQWQMGKNESEGI